jgi:hypothetical protein
VLSKRVYSPPCGRETLRQPHPCITALSRRGVHGQRACRFGVHRFRPPVQRADRPIWARYSHRKGAHSGAERCPLWCHTARIKTVRFASICNERAPKSALLGRQKPNGTPNGVGGSGVMPSVLPSGMKRRGRDSNPGYPHGYSGFQDRCNRPLCHLSGCDVLLARFCGFVLKCQPRRCWPSGPGAFASSQILQYQIQSAGEDKLCLAASGIPRKIKGAVGIRVGERSWCVSHG